MNTEEIPESLLECVAYFADEVRAHDFFVSMRWPDGVRCAHCGSENVGNLSVSNNGKRRVWNCKACKRQFTAKIGTIFAESPLPLSKWLPALWLITNAKNGISSCELARALKVTQKSAWFMGHRIRTAIQRGGGIVRLDGVVEVDETFIGGRARTMNAKQKARRKSKSTGQWNLTPVQALLERGKDGKPSQAIAIQVANNRKKTLDRNVRHYVLKGAEVHTDELKAYEDLSDEYTHKVVNHAECYVKDGVHTNSLENFWCLLKRTIKGTYVKPEPFHLHRYLDEQTFRFNERRNEDGDRGRFLDVVKTTVDRRLTWKKLTAKEEKKD